MVKCAVKTCDSRSQTHHKKSGITFHRIPKDPVRKENWINVIRLLRRETDWWPSDVTVICSKHFKSQDKLPPKNENGYVRLAATAVPVIFDDNDEQQSEPGPSTQMEVDDLNVDTDEEIMEILETPREHKMRKIIKRLETVASRRLNLVKSFRQKNQRLKKINKRLVDIIKKIKRGAIKVKRKECN